MPRRLRVSLPVGDLRWMLETRWPTFGAKCVPLGIIFGPGSICAHEGGPTRAGESMSETMSRPACGSVTGPRGRGRGSTATVGGNHHTQPPLPRTPRGDRGRRGDGLRGQAWAWAWAWAWWLPAPTARGVRGGVEGVEGIEGIEGVRGWASWPREMGGIEGERGGGRTSGGEARGRGPWWPGKLASSRWAMRAGRCRGRSSGREQA